MSSENELSSHSFENETEKEFDREAEETEAVVEFSKSPYSEFFTIVSETAKNLKVRCKLCLPKVENSSEGKIHLYLLSMTKMKKHT